MLPKKSQQEDAQQSLGVKLENFLNMDHELILLSKAIDWSSLGDEYDLLYDSKRADLHCLLVSWWHLIS